jgi:predicted PhzF superfamily epimerase YddE/YHI9
MDHTIDMQVLRVFVDEEGKYGNPVGILIDEKHAVSDKNRQKITADSGFSEVVFVDHLSPAQVSIFNPVEKIHFSGHAVIGVSWFIQEHLQAAIGTVECADSLFKTWKRNDAVWVRAEASLIPPWNLDEVESVEKIEALTGKKNPYKEHTVAWTWLHKKKEQVRAKSFAPDWGIPEDEANGSGAMRLALALNQKIHVLHGQGSVIYAEPMNTTYANVGGLVVREEVKKIAL